MHPLQILITFSLALMTNIIVLVGTTSFIYWLDLQESPSVLIRYRKFIKVRAFYNQVSQILLAN